MIRWVALLLIGCTAQEPAKLTSKPALDPVGLLGKVQLPVLGEWSLRSVDDNVESTGWFESADTIGPLTF